MTNTQSNAVTNEESPSHGCCNGHMVQFYKNSEYLAISIAEYIRLGLELGEAVLVIARPSHWMTVKASLKTLDVDIDSLLARERVVFINAVPIIRKIMQDGEPNKALFFDFFYPIKARMNRQSPKLRCYGEIVDILCGRNKIGQAVQVENFWNEILAENPSVSLMCGYHAPHLHQDRGVDEFQTIVELHFDVIDVESVRVEQNEDAFFRKIAVLEQRSAALKNQTDAKKQVDEELRATKAQLLQVGKLSILGELCAGIAHELNNPLAIIKGSVLKSRSVLRRFTAPVLPSSPVFDDALERLENIDDAATRMSKIVSKVLLFARQQSPSFSNYDVNVSVIKAIELFNKDLSLAGVEVKVDLPGEPCLSFGDPDLMMQVFLNIISNARDAMEAVGGSRSRLLKVSASAGYDHEIEVRIIDNGIGMDEPTLAKLFYPFFTTKEVGKGTGLGMSISHGIIKEHKGRIVCESLPGKGSTFRVFLPRVVVSEVRSEGSLRSLFRLDPNDSQPSV